MTGTEAGDRVGLACPSCGGDRTVHEVLRPGGRATVRCTDCGHTHKTRIRTDERVEREVVVSQDGDSFATRIEVDPDDAVAVGEELVVDAPEALLQARVTSVEVGPEERVEEARMAEVETLWTRAVDNVAVRLTIHPAGDGEASRSLKLRVPGDREFTVGARESLGDAEFTVEGIQLRDGAGYRFDKLDHEGDAAFAKDVKRLYGRDESTSAWSAW